MLHFVQFHNPDVWGEAVDLEDAFSVVTSKSVRRLPGQRVWLLSRTGPPRIYFVASTFVVDTIETHPRRRFRNEAIGHGGQVLGPAARIDSARWWPKLLAQTGSFLWGLTEIRDEAIIGGLERLARGARPSRTRETSRPMRGHSRHGHRNQGAGFGDPESNSLVERAAVAFAKKLFRRRGWGVISVESEARGFDLICTRDGSVLHVEVKGVSGDTPSFVITSNEYRESKADTRWRALVVTGARSREPRPSLMTGSQFHRRFEIVPLDYRAVPK